MTGSPGVEEPGYVGEPADAATSVGSRRTVVGAILVDTLARPRRVGAARRASGSALDGHWEFPGGKMEPGETPEVALARELEEELSLTVVLGAEFTRAGAAWPITEWFELRLFFAQIATGELAPGPVHDAVAWVPVDRLAELGWLPSDAEAVAALADHLTSTD